MKNLTDFLSEAISSKSVKYWKEELGLDPTKVNYSKNKKAQAVIDMFTKADKLTELFDYLVSGIVDPMSEKEWIDYVAGTDITDYEEYNGPLN